MTDETKAPWQTVYEALPPWVRKLVDAVPEHAGYSYGHREGYPGGTAVSVLFSESQGESASKMLAALMGLGSFKESMSAPWPPVGPTAEDSFTASIVEMVADPDGCAFDQACAWGYRVEQHKVYCHHAKWPDHPNRCPYGWGTPTDAEACPGYFANPNYKPGE